MTKTPLRAGRVSVACALTCALVAQGVVRTELSPSRRATPLLLHPRTDVSTAPHRRAKYRPSARSSSPTLHHRGVRRCPDKNQTPTCTAGSGKAPPSPVLRRNFPYRIWAEDALLHGRELWGHRAGDVAACVWKIDYFRARSGEGGPGPDSCSRSSYSQFLFPKIDPRPPRGAGSTSLPPHRIPPQSRRGSTSIPASRREPRVDTDTDPDLAPLAAVSPRDRRRIRWRPRWVRAGGLRQGRL